MKAPIHVHRESCSRSHENVHTIKANMTREQNHFKHDDEQQKITDISAVFWYFSPFSSSTPRRLFELSFVSFNIRNKIWRKIITEIKALIFFLRVFLFWVGERKFFVMTSSSAFTCVSDFVSTEKSLRMLTLF